MRPRPEEEMKINRELFKVFKAQIIKADDRKEEIHSELYKAAIKALKFKERSLEDIFNEYLDTLRPEVMLVLLNDTVLELTSLKNKNLEECARQEIDLSNIGRNNKSIQANIEVGKIIAKRLFNMFEQNPNVAAVEDEFVNDNNGKIKIELVKPGQR